MAFIMSICDFICLGSEEIENLGIVIADNKNDESILEMCRQTQVIVNCVGPVCLSFYFKFYALWIVCYHVYKCQLWW